MNPNETSEFTNLPPKTLPTKEFLVWNFTATCQLDIEEEAEMDIDKPTAIQDTPEVVQTSIVSDSFWKSRTVNPLQSPTTSKQPREDQAPKKGKRKKSKKGDNIDDIFGALL